MTTCAHIQSHTPSVGGNMCLTLIYLNTKIVPNCYVSLVPSEGRIYSGSPSQQDQCSSTKIRVILGFGAKINKIHKINYLHNFIEELQNTFKPNKNDNLIPQHTSKQFHSTDFFLHHPPKKEKKRKGKATFDVTLVP